MAQGEVMMDETGMTYADKVGMIADVLLTWGEEAAQELADRYAVDLEALKDRG
jgi:hypothetical protein